MCPAGHASSEGSMVSDCQIAHELHPPYCYVHRPRLTIWIFYLIFLLLSSTLDKFSSHFFCFSPIYCDVKAHNFSLRTMLLYKNNFYRKHLNKKTPETSDVLFVVSDFHHAHFSPIFPQKMNQVRRPQPERGRVFVRMDGDSALRQLRVDVEMNAVRRVVQKPQRRHGSG